MDPNQQPMTPPPASTPQPPMPTPQPGYVPPAPASKTDGLGIASIGLAFIGLSPIAFILGLIGASKAKKESRSPILSRIGWIWGLIGTLAWLALIPLLILGILFAGADNKKFLNAVFDKDYETACTMWGAAEGSDRADCEAFLDAVNDKYTGYTAGAISSDNGEITMDITLDKKDGGTDPGSVTTKGSGVTDFIYGANSQSSLSDRLVANIKNNVAAGKVEVVTGSDSVKCLTQSSVEAIFPYATANWDTGDSVDDGRDAYLLDNVFFNADATSYEFASIQPGKLDKMAQVYTDNSSTDVMYKIRGQVKEGSLSAAGEVLAQQRFEKVRDELIDRGVPASRIVQLASKNLSSNEGGEKNVEVIVVTDCNGSGR